MDKGKISIEQKSHDIAVMSVQSALNKLNAKDIEDVLFNDILKPDKDVNSVNLDSWILNHYLVAYRKSLNFFNAINNKN